MSVRSQVVHCPAMFVCVCMCTPGCMFVYHVLILFMEARKGHWIDPLELELKGSEIMWLLVIESRSSIRALRALKP